MIIQKWDGRIVSVLRESNLLLAIITDITNKENPEEVIEIEFQHFFNEDIPFISEGSLFYWHIIEDYSGNLYNEIKLYRKTKKEIAKSIKRQRKIKKKSKKLFYKLNKDFINE
jgi:hypothetical protein